MVASYVGFKTRWGVLNFIKLVVHSYLNVLSCLSAQSVGGGATTYVSAVKSGK